MTYSVYINNKFARSFNTERLARRYMELHDNMMHVDVDPENTEDYPEYEYQITKNQ